MHDCEKALSQINHWKPLLAFFGCTAIGISQGDEHPLMSKHSCCDHIRSCRERCVCNKVFLLGTVITWLLEFDAVLSKSRMLRDMAISSAALPLALKTKRGLHFESLLTTN